MSEAFFIVFGLGVGAIISLQTKILRRQSKLNDKLRQHQNHHVELNASFAAFLERDQTFKANLPNFEDLARELRVHTTSNLLHSHDQS